MRASEIIKRLRSLLKHRPFKAEELELDEVVREVIALSSATAKATQLRIEQPSASDVKIRGDRVQLQQVVLNLILNGMDATNGSQNHEIVCTVRTEGASAIISVRDHGPGIPANQLEKIFESFVTTKDDGMGMGLSIARTIVEAHGGSIWAENAPDGGAIFRVRLPIPQRSAGAAEKRLAPVMS